MPDKNLTDKQLLELMDSEGLSLPQIERRTALIHMQSAARALDAANVENEKHIAAKEYSQRQWRARMADIQRHQEELDHQQKICHHKTGGMDRQGFFAGAGDIYGYCVSKQVLPTGVIYCLCFRCEREWWHPRHVERYFPGHPEQMSLTVAVIKGLFPLEEYRKMEREYNEMLTVPAKTFEGQELPGGKMFLIPQLEKRIAQENQEFQQYCKTAN
jgi:hypothetical protein